MKKQAMALAVSLIGIGAALPATAATMGFDLSQWVIISGSGTPSGSVDTTGAPASVTLNGGNNDPAGCSTPSAPGVIGTCEIIFQALSGQNFSFHWSYASTDIDKIYDQFGVILDGVRQLPLSGVGSPLTASGDENFTVNSSFAFYLNCTDCTGGAASATISGITVVPEPATLALLGLGLAALGARRKRIH